MKKSMKESKENLSLPGIDNMEGHEDELAIPGIDKPGRPKKSLADVQVYVVRYLKRAFSESREDKILKDEPQQFEASNTLVPGLHRPENLALLEAWVDKYMSVEGRNRMLMAIRKKNSHATKNITVSTATFYKLRSISEQVSISIDEIIDTALDDFRKKSLEKHKNYKPIRGEKTLF